MISQNIIDKINDQHAVPSGCYGIYSGKIQRLPTGIRWIYLEFGSHPYKNINETSFSILKWLKTAYPRKMTDRLNPDKLTWINAYDCGLTKNGIIPYPDRAFRFLIGEKL